MQLTSTAWAHASERLRRWHAAALAQAWRLPPLLVSATEHVRALGGLQQAQPQSRPCTSQRGHEESKRMRLQASRVGGTVWLSYWTESTDSSGHAPHGAFWYLGVYAGISGIQVLLLSRTHAVESVSLTWVCCRVLVACVMAGYDIVLLREPASQLGGSRFGLAKESTPPLLPPSGSHPGCNKHTLHGCWHALTATASQLQAARARPSRLTGTPTARPAELTPQVQRRSVWVCDWDASQLRHPGPGCRCGIGCWSGHAHLYPTQAEFNTAAVNCTARS